MKDDTHLYEEKDDTNVDALHLYQRRRRCIVAKGRLDIYIDIDANIECRHLCHFLPLFHLSSLLIHNSMSLSVIIDNITKILTFKIKSIVSVVCHHV